MATKRHNSEDCGASGEESDISKKSVTTSSDNDTRKRSVHLDTANVKTRNIRKTEEITGYRTIISRVPLYNKQFKLEPRIPSRSCNTCRILTKKEVDANRNISIMKNILTSLLGILGILLISYFTYTFLNPQYSGVCDMNKAENRDFNNFYGILHNKNHFTTAVADECRSNIIFKPVLPQTILKSDNSASSFMILAKYGTGKTLLRCQYFKSLQSKNYFKILILNKQINEYLERFVTETSTNGKNCNGRDCLEGWTKNEFAQLILSVLVTQFVDTFEKEQFDLPDISLDEKIELITIVCFYYNEQGVSKLENFINSFLKKANDSLYSASKAEGQILEQNSFQDKPLLLHLKRDLKKLSILRRDDKKLELLLGIIEGEGYQHIAIEKMMFGNVFKSLTDFTLFMKNRVEKPVVFIIDEIGENQYFFQENTVNKISLELFYRSSISQEIMSGVMAQNFYLSLFYPEIDGINIRDAISRNDKFPVYTIEWDTKSLINYGDYVLQEMNKDALTTRCKSLPDFKTLVNYTNAGTANIVDQIPSLKALHYFMEKLIIEMNNCANDVEKPFIATYENVDNAFKKSIE